MKFKHDNIYQFICVKIVWISVAPRARWLVDKIWVLEGARFLEMRFSGFQ